jgi:branched-chain amino acid transport system substrate-binding protein
MGKFLPLAMSALLLGTAAQAADVRVGMITTLSGPGGYLGEDIRDGFLLGLKQQDGKMGGAKVSVLVEDDGLVPGKGRQIASKFLTADKVQIITGIVFSNVAFVVAPLVLETNAFYISPNAAPSPFAGEKCDKNYFVASWQNDNPHEAAGQYATGLGYKKAFIMAPNYQAGKDVLAGFKRTFKGEILEETYTQMNQMDYASEIAKIRAAKPEMVFEFLPGGMGINFIKQYAQAGLMKEIPLVLSGPSVDEKILNSVGDVAVGIKSTMHWTADLPGAANEQFVKAFQAAYKRPPTVYASQGYDTAQLIASALRKTKGSLDNADAFRAALKQADFQSVRGAFKFGPNNHPVQSWYGRVVEKAPDGSLRHKTETTVLTAHGDAYAAQCPMK